MSEAISAAIPEQSLSASFDESVQMSAQLEPEAQLSTDMSQSGIILDDYFVTMEPIEGGNRLIVKRGNEVKYMDILNGANVQNITITEVE